MQAAQGTSLPWRPRDMQVGQLRDGPYIKSTTWSHFTSCVLWQQECSPVSTQRR